MFLHVEANTAHEAYDTVVYVLERFLQHLSVNQRRPFTYKPLIIEADDGKLYPVPKVLSLGRVTHYHLEQLTKDIQEAETACFMEDAVLDRALQYFEHALLLNEKRGQIANALSRHHRYLISAVFLNLWKVEYFYHSMRSQKSKLFRASRFWGAFLRAKRVAPKRWG